MLKLIIGRSGTGKSTLLLERVCAEDGARHILLVPEPQSHETERRLCAAERRACLYAEVLTFSRLASRVFQAAGGIAREELDAGGRVLLMYRAVQAVSTHLKVYAKPSRRPAFLTGLLAAVDELKSCCVAPEELIAAGEKIGGTAGEKLCDLGLICASYTALTARSALDPRDRLTRAAQRLASCRWAQGMDVYLDGFVDFTPQQMQMIRLLMEQGRSVTLALTCDHLEEDEDGAGVFSAARRTGMQMIRLARELGQTWQAEVCDHVFPARSAAMQVVEQELFGTQSDEPNLCGGDVQLFCAPDARTEVEWTAAKILQLVQQGGLRFRDIGVIARGYERYDALIESVFRQYDVPVFRSAMSDVMRKPVFTMVTAALDCVTGGYTYEDVFRCLKTDLTDLDRAAVDELENYVLRWDLRGSRWTQEEAWSLHPRGYGFAMEEADRALLAQLDELRRHVAAPMEHLRCNPDKTGMGQAKALYRYLEEVGLNRRLEERRLRLQEEGELGLAEEYRQLWEVLCTALEQCGRLLGDVPMELDEFSGLLRLVLSQYDIGTIPVSLDRVAAGELTRQSGHTVKVLFLLGADDGSLPGVGAQVGLLTDDDREMLSAVGVELGLRGRDRLHREMTAIYTACACPDQKLIVTWPDHAGAQELRPSFLVERLRRIFPQLAVQRAGQGEFRLAAARPALEEAGELEPVRQILERLPQWSDEARRLAQAERWQRGSLSAQAVRLLYGTRVPMSASRMDKYRSCHFSYFMRYGLEASPRRSAGFDAPEYGTFVHYVLQHVIADNSWRSSEGGVDSVRLRALTAQVVERYVQEELGGLEHQTARFRYLFARLLSGVDQIVANVAEELAVSRFRPVAFELGFGRGQKMPPVEEHYADIELSLTGFVDRVDAYESDGKLYLRVIDYKTGKKTFDLTEVASGIGLQMLLYLFALEKQGKGLFGREIVPAGVLYLPAHTARVAGRGSMSEEKRQELADRQLRRRGLLLDDPEVLSAMEQPGEAGYRFLPLGRRGKSEALVSGERFARLERHVRRVLREICTELAGGNIAADPYWRGSEKNACRYCEYAAACHFEPGWGGDCRRWLPAVSAEEFWDALERNNETPAETTEEVTGRAL